MAETTLRPIHVDDEYLLELVDGRLAELESRLHKQGRLHTRQPVRTRRLRGHVKRMRRVIHELIHSPELDP